MVTVIINWIQFFLILYSSVSQVGVDKLLGVY